MYVLSKNRMQIINLAHVTAMYLGADETSIKVDFVTGRGSQIGKYVSDTYAKKALELLILKRSENCSEIRSLRTITSAGKNRKDMVDHNGNWILS